MIEGKVDIANSLFPVSMHTTFKREKEARIRTTTTVSVDERSSAETRALQAIALQVSVKGFRRGKAPIKIVRAKVGEKEVLEETIRTLVPEVLKSALQASSAKPVLRPSMNVVSSDPLTIEIVFIERPVATLKKPGSIAVEKRKPAEVTAKDVDAFVTKVLKHDRTETVVDRPAQQGDLVRLTMKATDEGKNEVPELSTHYTIELGTEDLLSELEPHVLGMKKGDKKTVTINFDADHDIHSIRKKKVTIELDVKEVSETKLPELSEQYLRERLRVEKTPEVFKVDVKTMLENKRLNEEMERREEELYEKVRASVQVDLPEELVEAEAKDILADFNARLTSQGIKLEDWMSMNKKEPSAMLAEMKDVARKRISLRLGMQELATFKKIEPSAAEIHVAIDEARKDAESSKYALSDEELAPGGSVHEQVKLNLIMKKLVQEMINEAA